MVINAQEWLESQEEYNTQEKRNEITELNISNKGLEGSLDVSGFGQLEGLYCENNQLSSLNLGKYSKLKKLNCSRNQLTDLNINDCLKITELKCFGNQLEKIDLKNKKNLVKFSCQNNRLSFLDLSSCENLEILKTDNWEKDYENFNELSDISFLSQLPNPEKLKVLHLHANNIKSDLKPFSRFTSLEELDLGLNGFSKEFTEKRGNKFYGSLEPLKSLSKLKNLDIGNTDIDSGLEHLSDNVRRLSCSVKERPDSKVVEIRNQLSPCSYDIKIWREWQKKGVNSSEIAQLVEAGVEVNDYSFADYLRQKTNYQISNNSNIEELEEEYEKYCQVQTWLDFWYPNDKKKETIRLNINKKNLKGDLTIEGWENLEKLDCSKYENENNNFPKIVLGNLPKLRYFAIKNCGSSELTINYLQIQQLVINESSLTDLDFLKNIDIERLTSLNIFINESLLKDLPLLDRFKNLERLDISTVDIDNNKLEEYLPNIINDYYLNGVKVVRTREAREAEEWLNNSYPDKKKRVEVKELDINKDNNDFLKGGLDLKDFINLEKLNCMNNYLTNINLLSNNKLTHLDLTNNNFSEQDLSNLSHLINLKFLSLGNTNKEKIVDNVYNRFIGSLKHLRKLNKLEFLNISNTDIDSGLEYLSDSLKEIVYSTQSRPEAKVDFIKKTIESYVSTTIREKRKEYWLDYGPKREEELEEEVSALKVFKNDYLNLWSIGEGKIGDEAKKIISCTKDLYINEKKKELDKLEDALDRKDKYLLKLLSSLGNFKQIKEKFLQENLTTENKRKFDLIREDLKQLKVVGEKETSLVSEEKELKEKRDKLKTELEKLLTEANNRLGEEPQYLLEVMLETQAEIVSLESDFRVQGDSRAREKLNKLKSLLTGKGLDIEDICQKQLEVAKLDKVFKWLGLSQSENQVFQLQVEVSQK